MRFTLKDYQSTAVGEVLRNLADAREDFHSRGRNLAFSLTATTGAGKTVMAAAVFEALFEGSEDLDFEADPTAVVLWMTDDPALNEQTRHRLTEASDRLSYSRLRVIADYGFDQEKFEPGHIYFLNRHKLTAKTFVTHSDKRTYTVWETIQNTIEDPNLTLYLVLDEAHRGMKAQSKAKSTEEEKDRASTILRLINGNDGMAPVPIVWGISATVERFNEAMKDARARTTLPAVTVDPRKVQDSGLLKDDICLDIPDESGAFETTLLRQATLKIQESEAAWEEYTQRESLPDPVLPLLVVQVPNTPSELEMTRLLTTIYDEWPELADDAVANVFGEHKDETYGNFTVPYLSPEHVQDATHVRVLLAKDAISTGWDCPRAEVLCSLRPATDRTYITQLVGRMVRTPLARRIDSDPRLNAVSCFLPHFDKATTTRVVNALMGDFTDDDGSERNKVPGRRVLIVVPPKSWRTSYAAARVRAAVS